MDPGVNARRPIFVAIGGDSGSGRSTLTAGFYRIFPTSRISSLCLDDYHSLDRREDVLAEIEACKAANPGCYIKLVGYDRRRQTQAVSFVVQRP